MDVWVDDHHQSQDTGWDLGQAASQRTGVLRIKEDKAAADRLGSTTAPRDSLQAESQGLHPSSESRNSTEAEDLPEDFDWQAYLAYYPDLVSSGISSESGAQQHYLAHGRQEGRVHRRLKVLMHYTACTGLINQHYSHIAAFTLSSAIGAELVLAPGLQRDSFASYFSAHNEQNEVTWTSMSTDQLLDVDRIIEEWRARGMDVHKTPPLPSLPNMGDPDTAYPQYQQSPEEERLNVRLSDIYLKAWDLPELVERTRKAVVEHAARMELEQTDAPIDHINLYLPCTFFMLRSISDLPRATMVARTLFFAPLLTGLADEIVAGMTAAGAAPFNSLHLRIEKDAKDWSTIMGGTGVLWEGYAAAMQEAGFDNQAPLYTASGLLTYGAAQDMVDAESTLTALGFCSSVHTKEMYLPSKVLDGLASEQKALVDFLVLARGARYVGFGSSTFSFFLREHRTLQGLPRSSSVLVDASVIGTDALFQAAATIV
ncbi:g1245 [Coccomyxa viridis]|uniref:O-fucosyltransferase family protein n=1 Tax=Coccomyxa viridis TaxID=1274662 RepID=A0ABP1FPE0_9CHLO